MEKRNRIKKIMDENSEIFRLLLMMIFVFILVLIIIPDKSKFLSMSMFRSMMTQMPEIGILATAVTFAMLLGGIDLSVVGIGNLCGIIASMLVLQFSGSIGGTGAVLLAYGIAMMIGGVCGAFNGIIVHYLGIPAMLATLGTMQIFQGIAIIITNGSAVTGMDRAYGALGTAQILGIPAIMILFILIIALMTVLLQKRKFGMDVYMLGTNNKASVFSGISNGKITICTFIISGILSAVAGIIISSRAMSAKADYGSSYILQCLLVAILGGISPFVGKGKVIGIVLSIITLQILSSGFNILRFSSYQKTFIWGFVLILVMVINHIADERKQKGGK